MKLVRPRSEKVDKFVTRFTREILGLARQEDIPFSYVGHRQSKAAEINKVMDVNSKVVRALLRK